MDSLNKIERVSLSVLMPVYNEFYTVGECVERVMAVNSRNISELELIIVDDGSKDGTREILRELGKKYPHKLVYIEHERNQGKGAAIRTAIASASKDVCVIQDADLEYNPNDFDKLIEPFIHEKADAVFGSRFLVGEYARVLNYRHAIINHILTVLTNIITDINFTDMETCYKAVRTRLLKSIPIRSNGFDLEPELSIKLAKRGAHIFEVPISYSGRTVEEGKKIGFKDGLHAFRALLHYWLIDDIYLEDDKNRHILSNIFQTPKLACWLAETVRPHFGRKLLEINAGLANLTRYFIPRVKYTVGDINDHYLGYLKNYCKNKPYLEVKKIDLTVPKDFDRINSVYDTVVCFNALEYVKDDQAAVRNLSSALVQGGKAVIIVPQNPWLFSALDKNLGYARRYTADSLGNILRAAGFEVEHVDSSFNKIGVVSWIVSGKIMKAGRLSKVQLKLINTFLWFFKLANPLLPWKGLSLICVARKL